MRDWIRKHSGAILAGLVSSFLFLYLLEPLLGFLVNAVVAVTTLLGTTYLDQIYSQAAHLETHNYAFWILTMVFGVTTGFATSTAFIILGVVRPRRSVTKDGEPKKPSKLARLGVAAFLLFGAGWGLVVLAGNYMQLSAISTFKRDLRIVAPFIDDHKEESLLSAWSLMQSEADYEAIRKELGAIAGTHGIALPENAIYSPFSI